MRLKTVLQSLAAAAALAAAPLAQAAFDPVNDDTDIFLANPQFAATRPNVLLFVDNSSNWGQSADGTGNQAGAGVTSKYSAVRAALAAVLGNSTIVTDSYNVGLAMFVETGNPNNSTDGAYMRYGVRQMTGTAADATTNKGKLISAINALDRTGDAGNSAVYSLAMAEMFKYYAGLASRSGHGKEKADAGEGVHFSTGREALTGSPLPASALPACTIKDADNNCIAGSSSSTTYVSPITDACQKNFIIFISNGEANDNTSAIATAETLFTSDTGSTPTQIPLSPSGAEGVVADEYAKYMANGDCNPTLSGVQNVITYTIDIIPKSTGQGPAHTALLKSMASNGKGKYFAVNSIADTTQIETALKNIFSEVQAVNSVFASTTLPVSVNVRGTNLNQVYIGVFRPDSDKSPRWLGNLKLYKLGVNTATSTLFLADATGAAAENASTGFITNSATSYWTTDETVDFWTYRDASENGYGGASDSPDGDLVEKGGAAQQLRIAYPTAQTSRNVYTCTGAAANGLCAAGASLSASAFNTTNVSAADIGAYTTVAVATATAAEDLPANPGKSIVSVTTGAAHGLAAGNTVRIEGASPSDYNGDFTVLTVPSTTQLTYRINTVLSSTKARATSSAHGMNTSDLFVIDATDNAYDAASPGSAVTRIDADNFDYTVASTPVSSLSGSFSATSRKLVSSLTASAGLATTARASVSGHSYGTIGSTVVAPGVTITGANESAFNCTPASITILTADSFSYTTCGTVSGTSATAQATTVSTNTFVSGMSLRIRGTGSATYDGLNFSVSVTDASNFTFAVSSGPSVTGGIAGVVISGIDQPNNNDTATVTTAAAHNFTVGTSVQIVGTGGNFVAAGGCPGHNTHAGKPSFNVESTPTSTTFTIIADKRCPDWSGANAVTGFTLASIVPVISATGTIYSQKGITVTLLSPLSTATGTVTAGNPNSGDTAARDLIVNWIRGQDNNENENSDCTGSPFYPCSGATGVGTVPRTSDVRASVHGDVLHSRPAVVNYGRYGDENDIYAFYGSNDGMLRAVKGGTDYHDTGAETARVPGSERWSFVAKEFFSKLKRLRSQTPSVSATNPKDYFFDGSIGVYQKDANGNGILQPSDSGDKVYLYLTMRRGGEFIYALNVTDPGDPKLLWRKGYGDTGWEQAGQTWSEPKITKSPASLANTDNPDNVILIFGGGYDNTVEDVNPCLLDESSTTAITKKAVGSGSVTYTAAGSCTISGATGGSTSATRTRGRGILVVDAFDGTVVWQASAGVTTSSTARAKKLNVPGMTCAIPSDVQVLDKNRDGVADRVYVGDTCGQVWRVDMTSSDMDDWAVTKIAALSSSDTTDVENQRKFLFPPDLVFGTDGSGNYTAVLLGSGDREHPFDTTVVNRFYMLKDRDSSDPGNPQAGATNATSVTIAGLSPAPSGSAYADSDIFDATNTALVDASDPLGLNGWKITLGAGEKVVSSAVTVSSTTFFNTNQPSATAGGGTCGSNLGIAREYLVGFADASATVDLNASGTTTIADRSTIHAGGGYLPSPVPVVVEIDGKRYQAVISGTSVQSPPGLTLDARTRVFWYKEVE